MKTMPLRHMAVVAASLLLSGCTVFSSFSEVEALNQTQATGSAFTQALAKEYREFANDELYHGFDYPDSLHFARKGLAAAAGAEVQPELIENWNIQAQDIAELSAARTRLISNLNLGSKEDAPNMAATAQARFDCWLENAEEQWRQGDGDACKNEFNTLMGQLEALYYSAPKAQSSSHSEAMGAYGINAASPMLAQNAMYLIFFDWDSARIDSVGQNVVNAVSTEVSSNPPASINVTGHADTSGPRAYNKRLAFKRANNTRDALVKQGVDPSLIRVDAKGETQLLVPTKDNVREPANRHVNITFE